MNKPFYGKGNENKYDYLELHRNIKGGFFYTDLDVVEYRIGRGIVALIESTGNIKDELHLKNCKRFIWERTVMQRDVLTKISQSLKIPAFFVIHTKDLSIFHVHNIPDVENFKVMNKAEHIEFIKNL